MMEESPLGFLFPSLWEAEVTISAAIFLVAVFVVLEKSSSSRGGDERGRVKSSNDRAKGEEIVVLESEGKNQFSSNLSKEDSQDAAYMVKLELLAAKYLIGANLNGTSDPYAIISCGDQKRFSSMVPNSRNPLWGEEFIFFVHKLPVQVRIAIYDWDIVCKCKVLGSAIIPVEGECQTGAIWYNLDSKSGQVCVHVSSCKLSASSASSFPGFVGVESCQKISDKRVPVVAHQDPGPLQAIFKLPQDEVIHHSYSCALERSFLYHGRMYISAWHLCFHSNVFHKQLKVIVPLEDIDEIKRSQHAFVNPAITVILHIGAGGHGVPPLCSRNGRVRYKFASFWNRNHSFRCLQNAIKKYRAIVEAEKQASSLRKVVFPCTAEQFFVVLLSDNSKFFEEYRSARKDTNLNLSKWYISDEYDGQVRKVTFRSLCHSPLCPPDTAVTEMQHIVLSNDKKSLVYETMQQAHDVPFGSYFEIHCRWSLETNSKSSCLLDIKVGVNLKKWCILQSKIKSGATEEYKREVGQILKAARAYVLKSKMDEPAGSTSSIHDDCK
ncbi:BAG-associated GRAM protein 1-like isoform X3 [Typha angustifolia]|uniref:BAG-associated GRAM protein 1-like isoform X3 n=1 Tax=Typha angustifolia TaxID=59011 RepID=UPI003C2F4ADA